VEGGMVDVDYLRGVGCLDGAEGGEEGGDVGFVEGVGAGGAVESVGGGYDADLAVD